MPATDDTFVPLAQWLQPRRVSDATAVLVEAAAPESAMPLSQSAAVMVPEMVELARDVRLFRARLADAFDAAHDTLLRAFGEAVLGRELLLASVDISAIAARIFSEHPTAQPLRLRVAPSDADAVRARGAALPPIVVDADLGPGDAILEFADCQVDARLAVRLSVLLEGAA